MTNKIPTEVYSRVSGYYRPVSQWNGAKREEFSERAKLKYKESDNEENSFGLNIGILGNDSSLSNITVNDRM